MSFIPHLVEFHEKYGDKGLAIIAITGEDKAKIEKFAKEKGMTYPVAFDPGSKISSGTFAVRGIPHSILVDPKGVVAWEGHPSSLPQAQLEELLAKADVFSLREVDKSLAKAAAAFKAGQFATAQKAAEEMAKKSGATDTQKADAEYILDEIKKVVEGKMKSAEEAVAAKRYLSAQEDYDFVAARFKGTDHEAKAKEALKAMLADPSAKNEIEAAKAYKQLMAGAAKIKKEKDRAKQLGPALKSFISKYKDTQAAKQAEEQLNGLK